MARATKTRGAGNVLGAMTRLKQVCNHPAHLLADGSALAVVRASSRSWR